MKKMKEEFSLRNLTTTYFFSLLALVLLLTLRFLFVTSLNFSKTLGFVALVLNPFLIFLIYSVVLNLLLQRTKPKKNNVALTSLLLYVFFIAQLSLVYVIASFAVLGYVPVSTFTGDFKVADYAIPTFSTLLVSVFYVKNLTKASQK